MTQYVVLDLQQECFQKNTSISDLVRKAHAIARKLKNESFAQWTEMELHGYPNTDNLPSYRTVSGTIRAFNPMRGWIPVNVSNPKQEKMLTHREIIQPIGGLEHLLANVESGGIIHIPYPSDVQRRLSEDFEISLHLNSSAVHTIVDCVKSTILNWALKLEEDGILGEGLLFSSGEREKARQQSYNVMNFYGPVSDTQIQQDTSTSHQKKEI